MDSKANAKEAKEEKAKESATLVDQPGSVRESATVRTRAKAKAKYSNKNVRIAEKLDFQPANAPRAK